jgi:RimJ/RimL family protein N-acetyltransferase
MLGGDAPSPGLLLPPGGVEAAPVLKMLRDLAAAVRTVHPVSAWLIMDGGEAVGLCSIIKPANESGDAEIGYGIAESRRKRGHATRAIRLMIVEVLRDPKVRGIVAGTAVANVPSQRVLEESGFVKTGTRHDEEDGDVFVWRHS